MSNDTDKLLDELIENKTTQARASKPNKTAPPQKSVKASTALEYKEVLNDCACSSCHAELTSGEKHWVFDDWVEQTWHCVTCAWEQQGITPPE